MLKFEIITVLPQLVNTHLDFLPFKRAISKNSLQVNVINLRDFALDSYGTIDDKPYGGGVGMVLMIEPIYKALLTIYPEFSDVSLEFFIPELKKKYPNDRIILMDPKGDVYKQAAARDLSTLDRIVFICGRYEGVDDRVTQFLITNRISIGDYVLSGGELPALTIMESITRLIPGALEKSEAVADESFSESESELEYPQYTRPEEFKGQKVPEILLSGHHKKIQEWKNSKKKNL